MKATLLILLVCIASPVSAQEPAPATFAADAPIAPGKSEKLYIGEPAPFTGQLVDEQEQVRRARINARNAAELADLKRGNVTVAVPVAIAIVAACIVGGVAAGFGVASATAPKH